MVGTLSIGRGCTGRTLQKDGAETEKAHKEKLLVIPAGLAIRFLWVDMEKRECKMLDRYWKMRNKSKNLRLSTNNLLCLGKVT